MREAVVRSIGEQRAALLSFLGDVEGDTWRAASACAGWSVADVVAHLVEGELAFGRIARGEETAPGQVDLSAAIERWRALPGEAVRAALWQHGRATQRVLESLDDERWGASIRAFGCRRIGQLARLALFEGIVHSHDITTRLGAEPVWAERIGFAAGFVLRAAPATLARHGAVPGAPISIAAGDGRWVLAGDGGTWELRHGGEAPTHLVIGEADLVLATTGRLPIAEALARSQVRGDASIVERVLRAWQVVAP